MPVRVLAVAAVAAAAAALCVAPASAAPEEGKEFQMFVESPEWAGVTDSAYTITLRNTTGTQQLGSANVTIPTATVGDVDFTVTSEPVFVAGAAPGATIARPGLGKVIELRDLALAPAPAANSSVTISLGLRLPCVGEGRLYRWGVDARQSNEFSGQPGNRLGPVSGTIDTRVDGSCKLRFADEPAGAEKNAQIRADAFRPASTRRVTVEAIDGSPAPQRLTWFAGPIDLRLVQSGPGALTPDPASSAAVAGLASFASLAIDASGNYNLRATTTAPGITADDSADFQIVDDVGECNSSSCRAQVNGRQTSSTLTGVPLTGSGFALLSLNLGTPPVCANYTPAAPDYYEFQLAGVVGDKTILTTFSKTAVKSVKGGASGLEICFAAPDAFTAKTGPAVPFDYDGEPLNGAEGFVGLLPDCPASPAGPCILDRSPAGGGGAEVRYFVPAAWGDPRGWG